jgi:hypothetical protein
MTTQLYKAGQRIQAYIFCSNEILEGVIEHVGTHKGRVTYSIGGNRFVYHNQVWGAF